MKNEALKEKPYKDVRSLGSILALSVILAFGLSAEADELQWAGGTSGSQSFDAKNLDWIVPEDQTQTKVAWTSGSLAVFPSTITAKMNLQWFNVTCSGVRLEGTGNMTHYSNGTQSMGAEGIVLLNPIGLGYGYYHFAPSYSGSENKNPILKLTADQTWECRSSEGMASLAIGHEGFYHRTYAWSYVGKTDSVKNLKIKGRLAAFFYSQRNDLSDVDVRVESPAELVLAYAAGEGKDGDVTYSDPTEGMLHAKSVTFSGDGIRARFGCKSAYPEKTQSKYPVTAAAIDADHLAPDVVLEDGADLMVSNAVFGLEKLAVTGGVSAVTGSTLSFACPETELEIAEDATLALDAFLQAATPGARLLATGGGTLELAKGIGALASITLAEGTSLRLKGTEPMYAPLIGSGNLEVVLNADEELFVADLSGWTGPVEVKGGTLILTEEPTGGVTTSGGGKVVYGSTRYIADTPVENEFITVGAGETLYVGGNGLKASTTVWMNGGTLRVVKDSVISATITQDVTSVYSVDTTNVVATFAGPWLIHTDYVSMDTPINCAKVYGGNVQVSGGLQAATERDYFYVYSGEIRFSETDGYFDGYFGVPNEDCPVTRWTFDGVTYEACYKSANHIEDGKARTSVTSNIKFYYHPTVESTLAFVNGGTLKISTSRVLAVCGKGSSTPLVTMYFDDGYLQIPNSWGSSQLSYEKPYSPVVVDFRSGEIEMMRPFQTHADGSLLWKWSGGTLRPEFSDKSRRMASDAYMFKGSTNMTMEICGPDCVLDLGSIPVGYAVTNANMAVAVTGTSEGRLTVKGPGQLCLVGYDPAGSGLQLDAKADLVIPSVSADTVFGEVAVNATDCSITAEAVEGTPTVGALRIGPNGEYPNTVLAGIGNPTAPDLTFDDGALWKLVQGETLALAGKLTFNGAVRYSVRREQGAGASAFTAAAATGGVDGTPEWVRADGPRYQPEIVGNEVRFGLRGVLFVVR